MKKLPYLALGLSILSLAACSDATDTTADDSEAKMHSNSECIAPADPGGGFDLTCKLAQTGLQETGILDEPIKITYMPGGVGAVAYDKIVTSDRANDNAIIAFSTGSILNLSQSNFGQFTEKDVKWLAAIGTDYGAVAVNANSPIKDLQDLVDALQANPKSVVFGAGGSIGSQDWMQTAILAQAANVDPNNMSYVEMEGGGEAVIAVLADEVSAISGGIAELMPEVAAGKVRVLAVFADERLDGSMADIPTAKEQGYDVIWPVVRGFYMGPDVSDSAYDWWKQSFDTMLTDPKFAEARTNSELLPFSMTGKELEQYVYKRTNDLRKLSVDYNLIDIK